MNRIVGTHIRVARAIKKWSQQQLARRVGASQGYIGRVEAGEINISVQRLVDIAAALETPVAFFFEPLDAASLHLNHQTGEHPPEEKPERPKRESRR